MTFNKVKMVECSNIESVGYRELGKEGDLHIDKTFSFNSIRSSSISNITFDEDTIEIKTRNTNYVFQQITKEIK